MKLLNYPVSASFVAGTTLRDEGFSKTPFNSANMAFYVGDNYDDVMKNRQALADLIHIPLDRWVIPKITHSTNFRRVYADDGGKGARDEASSFFDCDGLYTFEKDVLLGVFHADCSAMLITHEPSGLCAAIHSGWAGSVKQIVTLFCEHIRDNEGIPLDEIKVFLSPSIGKMNFEIGLSVILQMENLGLNYLPYVQEINPTTYAFDFVGLNIEQFLNLGVKKENIIQIHDDVYELSSHYYSYRRDNKVTGRHLTFIART